LESLKIQDREVAESPGRPRSHREGRGLVHHKSIETLIRKGVKDKTAMVMEAKNILQKGIYCILLRRNAQW
jgi:hypothetical protein